MGTRISIYYGMEIYNDKELYALCYNGTVEMLSTRNLPGYIKIPANTCYLALVSSMEKGVEIVLMRPHYSFTATVRTIRSWRDKQSDVDFGNKMHRITDWCKGKLWP